MRLKAPMKLSRKMAVLEFSSSNGYSSFTLDYECRSISIIDTEDGNQINFSYLVYLPYRRVPGNNTCEERGYNRAADVMFKSTGDMYWGYSEGCITTFQGKKCSRQSCVKSWPFSA